MTEGRTLGVTRIAARERFGRTAGGKVSIYKKREKERVEREEWRVGVCEEKEIEEEGSEEERQREKSKGKERETKREERVRASEWQEMNDANTKINHFSMRFRLHAQPPWRGWSLLGQPWAVLSLFIVIPTHLHSRSPTTTSHPPAGQQGHVISSGPFVDSARWTD